MLSPRQMPPRIPAPSCLAAAPKDPAELWPCGWVRKPSMKYARPPPPRCSSFMWGSIHALVLDTDVIFLFSPFCSSQTLEICTRWLLEWASILPTLKEQGQTGVKLCSTSGSFPVSLQCLAQCAQRQKAVCSNQSPACRLRKPEIICQRMHNNQQ